MKRGFIVFTLVIALGTVMVGCSNDAQDGGNKDNGAITENNGELTVDLSNLKDAKEQEDVKKLLLKAGIEEKNIDKYIEYINDYNDRVDAAQLKSGEISTIGLYAGIMPEPKLLEDGRAASELNCRLSAYELFKDFITTDANITADNYLMFDLDAIDYNDVLHYTAEERQEFINFFNPVSIGDVKDPEEIKKLIQEELKNRNIKIKGNGDISIINLYINDEFENKMFVGHSAIMIKNKKDYILLEKYSASAPFQVSKFSSEKEIINYIFSRNDIYGSDIKPMLFINNSPVK